MQVVIAVPITFTVLCIFALIVYKFRRRQNLLTKEIELKEALLDQAEHREQVLVSTFTILPDQITIHWDDVLGAGTFGKVDDRVSF